jgi:dGTPase
VEAAIHKNPDFAEKMSELKHIIAGFLEGKEDEITFTPYGETYFINNLIHKLIMNITINSVRNLKTYAIQSCEDVKEKALNSIEIITFDPDTKAVFDKIKAIIYQYIYGLHTIQTMDEKAVRVVKDLFEGFTKKPELLPPEWYYRYNNIKSNENYDGAADDKIRVICDYIATMTDRFALDEHERLFNPRIKI